MYGLNPRKTECDFSNGPSARRQRRITCFHCNLLASVLSSTVFYLPLEIIAIYAHSYHPQYSE